MAMQTIPSRLTIWTSFKGLPTASPFFRAKRYDAARRSDGTGKFQSPWGGTLGQPHGLFNFPALIRTPLADLLAHARTFSRHLYSPDGLSLIYWRVPCAAAAARCAADLVPFTAPLRLAPYARCCCGRLFTIRTYQRDSRSFLAYILFQALLRYGDLPVAKTKNPVSVQLFCDCGLSFVLSNQNGLPISRFAALLRLDTRFGASQQSLIAKKLQFRAFFCFWAPKIASNDAAG